ncbi:hypothetical protein [Janthinobacterium fluminis]|uniref:Uncharacterized protein n=1 Tax=Janthinobacterium fluminis TaxID=2987524 RepID=A0ABT5K0U2_9BURK|nr:hypothetical protein [Janthinobacterium fluminis]MDC8757377.1 hypothetical protein [Janthinobacterium fluminis]
MPHITHPTKEQVRAYMHQREGARKPPPTPAEIRRQLGWSNVDFSSCGTQAWFFPAEIAQLTTLLAVEWLFRAGGVSGTH